MSDGKLPGQWAEGHPTPVFFGTLLLIHRRLKPGLHRFSPVFRFVMYHSVWTVQAASLICFTVSFASDRSGETRAAAGSPPVSVVNPCFLLSLWCGAAVGDGFVSYPCCILVGNRKAPSGPSWVPDGPGRHHIERSIPGRGMAGRVSTLRRRRLGVGPTWGVNQTGGIFFAVLCSLGCGSRMATRPAVGESRAQHNRSKHP